MIATLSLSLMLPPISRGTDHPVQRDETQILALSQLRTCNTATEQTFPVRGEVMTRGPISTDSIGSGAPTTPPVAPQTFVSAADRSRLTPAALEALRGLARNWKLSSQEAADLLGVSVSTWDRIRGNTWKQSLSQ